MPVHTYSSRDFTRDVGAAKRAASKGPVFITDRGRPAHVLLSIEDYRRLTGTREKIADLLAMKGAEHVELEIPPLRDRARPANLG